MYPRKLGAAWEIYAPAKLNLYLDVLGRRTDGFHELETLMAPIRLYDRLEWNATREGSTGLRLEHDPTTSAPLQAAARPDEENLVWRAVQLLAQKAGVEPFGVFTLTKRIPVQAGLGGGSSNAAAALLLANRAWGLHLPRRQLLPLAAELGSDVPFFIAGQSAVCRGRGEKVEPVADIPRLDVVIAVPPQGIATAAAFQSLNAGSLGPASENRRGTELSRLLGELRCGAIAAASRRMTNALQTVAARLCPWIDRLGTAFASTGCHAHLLTGSGSAYFGVMRSAWHARRAAALLSSANVGTVFATSTCR